MLGSKKQIRSTNIPVAYVGIPWGQDNSPYPEQESHELEYAQMNVQCLIKPQFKSVWKMDLLMKHFWDNCDKLINLISGPFFTFRLDPDGSLLKNKM